MATPAELDGIPLFESLSESERRELAQWFETRSADEGTALTGEGAPGYSFFVLTEGTATVSSGAAKLADLRPGDFFGEIAIMRDGRRSATVTTTSPVKLLVMFGTEFRRLEQSSPAIAAAIEQAMRERPGPAA